jgi:hypothetical protein
MNVIKSVGILLLISGAVSLNAAVIFQDKFDNPGVSNTNWVANGGSNLTKSFANGECSITNTSNEYAALLVHTLQTKLDTFTLSFKVNRINGKTDGLSFCVGTIGNNSVGYSITLDSNAYFAVWKDTADTQVTKFFDQSSFVNSGYNEIKVSRKGSAFIISCNGKFVGSFIDAEYTTGNIALRVAPGSSVKYDDVLLTNEFEEIVAQRCFSDNFNNGKLPGWSSLGDGQVTVTNSVLNVKSSEDFFYYSTNLELENFVARVVVSHRAGDKVSGYGLFIKGPQQKLAFFAINSSRYYGVKAGGLSMSTGSNGSAIHGGAYVEGSDVYYYYDTLTITKQSSTGYIFKANGKALDTLPSDSVDFAISGIGIFCHKNLELQFDDFIAAEGTDFDCPVVSISAKGRVQKPAFSIAKRHNFIYDPLGRAMPIARNTGIKQNISHGMYLYKGQKKLFFVNKP